MTMTMTFHFLTTLKESLLKEQADPIPVINTTTLNEANKRLDQYVQEVVTLLTENEPGDLEHTVAGIYIKALQAAITGKGNCVACFVDPHLNSLDDPLKSVIDALRKTGLKISLVKTLDPRTNKRTPAIKLEWEV